MIKALVAKGQIARIVTNLFASIEKLDLPPINFQQSGDPVSDLETLHEQVIMLLEETSSKDDLKQERSFLRKYMDFNETKMISCLRKFVLINEEMCRFSNILHKKDYSLELLKSFRKLYQQLNDASTILYSFKLMEKDLEKQKQQLINQNIQIYEEIVQQTHQQKSHKLPQANSQCILQLRRQIDQLNQIIQQNDEEFSLQIQRYNHTLFDLQETIREYEVRLDKVEDYQIAIQQLQHQIIRMREEKCRDEMLIENMSRKIRAFQREKGQIFVSPRNSPKFVGSPRSRIRTSNVSSINNKSRSYFERMVSY